MPFEIQEHDKLTAYAERLVRENGNSERYPRVSVVFCADPRLKGYVLLRQWKRKLLANELGFSVKEAQTKLRNILDGSF